jgi:hypothetical protein
MWQKIKSIKGTQIINEKKIRHKNNIIINAGGPKN